MPLGTGALGPQHRMRDEVRRQVHLRGRDPLDSQPGEELGAGVLREVDRGRPRERLPRVRVDVAHAGRHVPLRERVEVRPALGEALAQLDVVLFRAALLLALLLNYTLPS